MNKPLRPLFVEFDEVTKDKLIADGAAIFPELDTTKLYMDGSMKEFLTALLHQYAMEKLLLVPTAKTDEALREYYDNDLILRTQAELLTYILDVNEHNRKNSEN